MPKEDRSSWVAVAPESSLANDHILNNTVPPPISAYQFFQRENTQSIKHEISSYDPTTGVHVPPTIAALSRAVGDRWKNLSLEEREKYDGLAREDRMRFARESHLRDVQIEARRERLRKEREVGILAEGTRRRRRTVLPSSLDDDSPESSPRSTRSSRAGITGRGGRSAASAAEGRASRQPRAGRAAAKPSYREVEEDEDEDDDDDDPGSDTDPPDTKASASAESDSDFSGGANDQDSASDQSSRSDSDGSPSSASNSSPSSSSSSSEDSDSEEVSSDTIDSDDSDASHRRRDRKQRTRKIQARREKKRQAKEQRRQRKRAHKKRKSSKKPSAKKRSTSPSPVRSKTTTPPRRKTHLGPHTKATAATAMKGRKLTQEEKRMEKERKELYVADRQEVVRKERSEQAKRRLEFLLKQSDIFSHFGNVKEDRAKLLARSGGSKRGVTGDDAADDSKVVAMSEDGSEGVRSLRRSSSMKQDNTSTNETQGSSASGGGGGENEADEADLNPESSSDATYLTSQPSDISYGKLRPYQLEGLNWMIRLQENGVNGILADEMGLGKTLQSISVLVYQKQYQQCNGPHLIVVPKSTLSNWMNELERWAPTLKGLRFHGTKEERDGMVQNFLLPATTNDEAREWEVCVTTYEVCNSDRQVLNKFAWNYLIIDEAHRLKNEQSVFSKVVRTFETKYRLLLTGTPLQNNLHELWALLNFLVPDVFASSEQFDEWFNLDIDDAEKKNALIGQLHKILRPFMLRRLKVDVEGSLPPKHETILFVGMSAMQKKLYKELLMRDVEMLQGGGVGGGGGSRTAILNIVMQLRKCAGHPYLFPGAEDRSLPPLGEHLVTNCGKMVLLDKLLKKLHENGHRVLLFTQMTRVLDILEDYLVMRKYKYCRIDGNTSYDVREESIDSFNAPGSDKFLFLLSTRAGGLGINLQTADVVILYDSDWNPQADLQAQDRAHRIGQKKVVNVYRLVTEHTIEEKIVERAQQKLKLDAMVVQQGRLKDKDKMSRAELLEAVRFGADKVFKSKDSSITDDDIDLILNIGKKRTQELNDKLQNAEKGDMLDFKLDGGVTSAQTYDGVDYSNHQYVSKSEQAQAELLGIIDLGKRERKQVTNYNEAQLYRDMEQQHTGGRSRREPKNKTKLPRNLRLPRLDEWHMFDKEALYALQEQEEIAYRGMDDEQRKLLSSVPQLQLDGSQDLTMPIPRSGLPALLSSEQRAEKERLLSEGFTSWERHHYSSFVKASGKHGRCEYSKIAEDVGKPSSEVEEFCKAFWSEDIGKKRISQHEYDRVVKLIEKGEKKLGEKSSLERCTAILVSLFDNPWVELEFSHANLKDKAFTLDEDRHLLCWCHKYGHGQWDAIKLAIRRSPSFRFDYFMKSLPTDAIARRCEQLMRAAEREVEHLEKKIREQSPPVVGENGDCVAATIAPVEIPKFKTLRAQKQAEAERELEEERVDLQKKVEDIENNIEEIQKRLKQLDNFSKDFGGYSISRNTTTGVPDELVPELVNLVARSGSASILTVAAEFISRHPGKFSKKQASAKIDDVAKKEKREEEGDTKVTWHIRPEYMNMLDVSTMRYLRKEKEHRQDSHSRGGGRDRKGKISDNGSSRKMDGGDDSCDEYGIPRSFPPYDGVEPPRECKKAFTHFCINTRREVKSSLDPEHRKNKKRIHAILKERWFKLTNEDKVIWSKWEKWDERRYAHDMDIFQGKNRKGGKRKQTEQRRDASLENSTSDQELKKKQEIRDGGNREGNHIPKKKRFKQISEYREGPGSGSGGSSLSIPKKRRHQ